MLHTWLPVGPVELSTFQPGRETTAAKSVKRIRQEGFECIAHPLPTQTDQQHDQASQGISIGILA